MKKGIITVICVLVGALLAHASINKREAKEEKVSDDRPSIIAVVNQ